MEKIPNDVKEKITAKAKEEWALQDQFYEEDFISGAKFGYLLSQTEIDQLQKLNKMQADVWKEKDETIESLRKENEELKAWKESMLSVMPPIQEIGKAIGVKLGDSIHDKILPYISELQKKVEEWKQAYAEAKEEVNVWRMSYEEERRLTQSQSFNDFLALQRKDLK
jgi:hypothetical protein